MGYWLDRRGSPDELVLGYMTLRNLIGALGFVLPFVLMWGGRLVFHLAQQPTISDYHATGMRDVFVGILVTLGVFLVAYRGVTHLEDWLTNVAGGCAVLVALFPNKSPTTPVHFIAAGAFFLLLGALCLFIWPRLDFKDEAKTAGKRRRNWVYRASGLVILACVAAIATYHTWHRWLGPTDGVGVFVLESVLVCSFGVSWFLKGGVLKSQFAHRLFRGYFTEDD